MIIDDESTEDEENNNQLELTENIKEAMKRAKKTKLNNNENFMITNKIENLGSVRVRFEGVKDSDTAADRIISHKLTGNLAIAAAKGNPIYLVRVENGKFIEYLISEERV